MPKTKFILTILDGCRPDGLAQARTPHLDSLWQNGAYSWQAQSVMPSISLPCHTSMFRSVHPQKHGIHDNTYVPSAAQFPSIIEVAFKEARHTALFTAWEELRDLAAPSHLYTGFHRLARPGQDNDTPVMQAALEYLTAEKPDFLGIYLGDVDLMGHAFGWMSPEYLRAIEDNDQDVGLLLDTLDRSGLRDDYVLMVISDHGGHERSHGTNLPEDMTIIWMLNGPGIKQGHEVRTPITLLDTAPTIAHALGLPRPAVWDGQPIYEAFVS
jgi:predicted AlkP superfamily pyrophosphatase or phosphodiesterase